MALTTKTREKIELSVWCANLQNRDVYTKSDPFVQFYTRTSALKPWVTIGQTEVVMNNLSPRFSKHIQMEFIFEAMQEIKMVVLDYDKTSKHDFLGACTTNIGHVMATPGNSAVLHLLDHNLRRPAKSSAKRIKGKQVPATLSVHVSRLSHNNDEIKFQFAGHKLANKDGLFGKSDPFYIISKRREGTTEWMPCFTSEVIDNNLNPIWIPRQLKQHTLGMETGASTVKIDVYDFDDHTSHDMIGSFTATRDDLKAKVNNRAKVPKSQMAEKFFPLRHPPTKSKYKKKSYKHSGLLEVVSFTEVKIPSMLEYIQGGMEINLTISIDYTGSNGNPQSPSSLHYMNPHAMNQYQTAMVEVGSILQEYDTDRMLTLYGFGGSVDGATSHCFPATLNPGQPDVYGVDGALQAYAQSFQSGRVKLSYPTYFAPMLRAMRARASNCMSQAHQKYHVMMILTDGAIVDMKQTVDEIVLLSQLPVSIIIIGVGNADFSSMEYLDGDVHPLRHSNPSVGICKRDCVQFVPYNEYKGTSDLAAATLQELPEQLERYMSMAGIKPNPPLSVVPGSMTAEAVVVAPEVARAYAGGATAVAVEPGAFPAPSSPGHQPAAAASVAQPYQQPGHAAAGAVAQPYGQPAAAAIAQPYGQTTAGAVAQPYGQTAAGSVAQPFQQPGGAMARFRAAANVQKAATAFSHATGTVAQPYGQTTAGTVAQPYGQTAAGAVAQPYGQTAAGAVAQPYGQTAAGAVAQPYGQTTAGSVAQPFQQPGGAMARFRAAANVQKAATAFSSGVAQPPLPPAARAPAAQPSLTVQVPAGVSPGQLIHIQTPDGQTLQVTVPAGCYAGAQFRVNYQPRAHR